MDDSATRRDFRFPGTFRVFERAWLSESIPALFARQVEHRPDALALCCGEMRLTYDELNRAANLAARLLLELVPSGPAPVALMLDQGVSLVAWILGILKAGLAYAPLDTRLPSSALARMLGDLGPRALVAADAYRVSADELAAKGFPVIASNVLQSSAGGRSDANPGLRIPPEALATIFYTSGSTGTPKGVADAHRNVLHNVFRYTNSLGFAPGDRVSLVQKPSFSGTVSSLFGALLNGATSMLHDEGAAEVEPIGSWLRRKRVTVFHGVPAIFRQIAPSDDRYPDLRLIRLEGDRATTADLECFRDRFAPHCVLVNGLGATECGLVRQYFIGTQTRAPRDSVLPIGFAVPDMAVHIVNDDGTTARTGEIGEIVVDSEFLALGYWNNASLTAQRFETRGRNLRRYYTGDVGRMDANGCLTHLGRRDHQPKIAGQFVDTGEVERILQMMPGVADAVLQFHPTESGQHRLIAYLVAGAALGCVPSPFEMRSFIAARVATAMIPSAFVVLDALPMTADGKLDRRRLPKPPRERPALPIAFARPLTEAHVALRDIWSEVLEIDAPGIDDPLFELGGDSFAAARIMARVVELDLPGFSAAGVADLLKHRTIRELAVALDERAGETAVRLPRRAWRDHTPSILSGRAGHAIAVVGMAARFPGAGDVTTFWENLRNGVESIARYEEPSGTEGEGTIAARGSIDDVDCFDAAFFGLTPRQAVALDPQQRVWLECVHHALEDAALSTDAGEMNDVGVFAGGRESTYLWDRLGGDAAAAARLLRQDTDDAHLLRISNDTDSIATRTSFLFDLRGPSVNVQSACSTSLVAIAQACNALVAQQCEAAVAGGVCITFPQKRGYRFSEGGIQSHDGHCRPFDAAASGTVFGDGVGVVVLKRLDDAVREGDRVHAVIRGWAVNNDGADKASFTAPNVDAQADVIAAAHAHARIDSRDVGYVEAHGTATRVGDPIEVEGLTRAFRRRTSDCAFCALGSVKSNVGHLDTAAGVAGFIKTVLALKHRQIPAMLHFRNANPAIDFAATPFVVADRLLDWKSPDRTRLAGVSSFGAGGTNCHLVLEEAADGAERRSAAAPVALTEWPLQLLAISARSREALAALAVSYERQLGRASDAEWAAFAAATQVYRSGMRWKLAVLANGVATAREMLRAFGEGAQAGANGLAVGDGRGRLRGSPRRADGAGWWAAQMPPSGSLSLGFVFTGQGAQYTGMARQLYRALPAFRTELDRCDGILRAHLRVPLLGAMFDEHQAAILDATHAGQPAMFAVGWSLAQVLMNWGIRPSMVAGHGVGELVAACVAGVFSLEDGLAIVAASNWTECVALVERRAPSLPLIGNAHGRRVSHELTDPDYWRDQARMPVRFEPGIRAMYAAGCEIFLEVGPQAVLAPLVTETLGESSVSALATLRRGEDDRASLLKLLGQLCALGVRVDWRAVHGGAPVAHVEFPAYPFQRRRFWLEGARNLNAGTATPDSGDPLLGARLRLPGSTEIRFEARFSCAWPTYLSDHRLFGIPVAPGAAHFAMLAQAARSLGGQASVAFERLFLLRPLQFPDDEARQVQLAFQQRDGGWQFQIVSAADSFAGASDGEAWTVHVIGDARPLAPALERVALDPASFRQRATREMSGAEFYADIWANQGGTGTAFRWIDRIWQHGSEALCHTTPPGAIENREAFVLHPGILEAACQLLHACGPIEVREALERDDATYVPFSVDRLVVFEPSRFEAGVWCFARLHTASPDEAVGDLFVADERGIAVAAVEGFCLRRIGREALGKSQMTPAAVATREHRVIGSTGSHAAAPMLHEDPLRYLIVACAEIAGCAPAEIAGDASCVELGLDSIMAVMLSNRIRRDLRIAIDVRQILVSESLSSLAREVRDALGTAGRG